MADNGHVPTAKQLRQRNDKPIAQMLKILVVPCQNILVLLRYIRPCQKQKHARWDANRVGNELCNVFAHLLFFRGNLFSVLSTDNC